MARVALAGGGAYNNRRHIHRPLEPGPAFEALRNRIIESLPAGFLFEAQSARSAHVSLLDSSTLAKAIRYSRRTHKLQPAELVPRLRNAVPQSGDFPLRAPVKGVRRLGHNCLSLCVVLACEVLDEERNAVHRHLGRLGHVSLGEPPPCHITLGTFARPIPDEVVKLAKENLPSEFMLRAVQPLPAEQVVALPIAA